MDAIRTVSFVRAWCDISLTAAAEIIEALEGINSDRVKIAFEPVGNYFVLEGRRKDVEQSAAALSKEIQKGINIEKNIYEIPDEHRKFKVPRFANMRQANIRWTRNPESNILDMGTTEVKEEFSCKWKWEPQYPATFEKVITRSGFNAIQLERAFDCKIDVDHEDSTISVKGKSDFVIQEIRETLEKLTKRFTMNWRPVTAHILYPLTKKKFLLRFAVISKQTHTIKKTTFMPDPELQSRLDKLYTIRLLCYEPTTSQYERCQFDVEPVATASTISQPREWIGFSFKEWARENAPANIVPKIANHDDDHAEELAIALANLVVQGERQNAPSGYGTGGRRLKPKKGQDTNTTATSVMESSALMSPESGADGPRLVPFGRNLPSLPSVLDRTELWVNEPGIWGPARPAAVALPAAAQEPVFKVDKEPVIDPTTGQFTLGSKPVEVSVVDETRPATTRKLKARKKKTAPSEASVQKDDDSQTDKWVFISNLGSQRAGLREYHSSEDTIVEHNKKTMRNVMRKGLDLAAFCKLNLKITLKFGRIALEIPKKDTKKDFPWNELDNTFSTLKSDLAAFFTNRMTREHYDAEFVTDLRMSKLGKLFSGVISQRAVYIFHGTFFGGACSVYIDAETFETQVYGPYQEFSTVYCHYPSHSWDSALKLEGRQVLDKELPEFSDFLQGVYIQPGRVPVVTYTQKNDSSLQIESVILQRETRHVVLHESLTANKEIMLRVVENQDLRITEHNSSPTLRRADGREREALRCRDRLWYSFALLPMPENDILERNRDLELGDKADWDVTDILGFKGSDELVERLSATAAEVISRIDGVGCPRDEIDSS